MRTTTSLFLLLGLIGLTSGHPQCNDFTPPQENPKGNRYCTMYKDFTCCTQKMDDDIKKAVSKVSDALRSGRSTCVPLLKEYACQECSPYAAHVFETEDFGSKRSMPGLCGPFCSNLYQKCKDAMKLLVTDPAILKALNSESEFCNLAKLNDKTYCWPDVIQNTDLRNQLQRQTSSSEACVCFQQIGSGLKNPMFLLSSDSKKYSNLFYVGTQIGVIHMYENGKPAGIFMDISDRAKLFVMRGDERGLLGMAFHSNFESTQKFYLFYIAHNGGILLGREFIRISEFRTKPGDLKQGDPTSERVILEIDKTTSIHHGGSLFFGHDGYLYITTGDGGDSINAQNRQSLLGNVLRLDVNKPSGYGIPKDNPFIGKGRDEIFAYGFRNPYRASQDRGDPRTGSGRGRIFLADVGQYSWEEVNMVKKGGNYGWKSMEGQKCNEPPCGGMTPPIAVYSHEIGQANIGGFVYRGCDMPVYNGMYIYADYQSKLLFRLKQVTSNRWERKEIDICGKDLCTSGLNNNFPILVMSIGEDYHGELYLLTSVTASSGDASGTILKIVDPRRKGSSGGCGSGGQSSPPTQPSPPTPPTPTTPRPPTPSRQPPTPEGSAEKVSGMGGTMKTMKTSRRLSYTKPAKMK